MSNDERRARAAVAVRAAYPEDDLEDRRVSDLIADLLHLAGDEVSEVLARALMHFEAERLLEAGR